MDADHKKGHVVKKGEIFMIFEKINFTFDKKNSDSYGKFIIEPLERGFGHTIGNALRRVLLSSLSGASVFAVEIDKVSHEFKEIPNVVEDAMTVILNLKKLVIKFSDNVNEVKVLKINKKKAGTIYAKDIECPDLVKVMNPDLEIAHLSKDEQFNMVLFAKIGRGYVTAERNKLENEQKIGRIYTDSNYSPILKVSYDVQPARVKYNSNFDKLIIEVWTNGSIKPQKAISDVANILVSHFSQFVSFKESIKFEKEEKSAVNAINSVNLENIFSVSLINSLKRKGITNINDLIQNTKQELKLKKISDKNIEEIIKTLKKNDLSLREE